MRTYDWLGYLSWQVFGSDFILCILFTISCHDGPFLWLVETAEYLPIDFCYWELSLEIHWLRSDPLVFKWGWNCLCVQIHILLLNETCLFISSKKSEARGSYIGEPRLGNNATIQTVLSSFQLISILIFLTAASNSSQRCWVSLHLVYGVGLWKRMSHTS